MAELRKEDLWVMADKLRNNMDSAEYKHVCLGLIFLKYISDSFERAYQEISQDEYADPEDRDEYLAKNVFWVPQEARWETIKNSAKDPTIGQVIDNAKLHCNFTQLCYRWSIWKSAVHDISFAFIISDDVDQSIYPYIWTCRLDTFNRKYELSVTFRSNA